MTCPVCPSAQHTIATLAAENRALSSENRALTAYLSTDWQGLLSETVSFAARNWPQSAYSAANKVLAEAEELKMAVNKARAWARDAGGSFQHVEVET